MSNTSYSFKENSHMIVNQGGEKKVMKKILSVALSTAMAFSMFASVAFGAEAKLTPQAQFDVLKAAGIVNGYPDGTAGLDKSITRGELAKVLVKTLNLEEVAGETGYSDVKAGDWYAPFITASSQAGILEGQDAVKKLFAPKANVTVQELAAILVRALKLEVPADADNTASDWAKGYVAAAVKAGYIEADANYQANATRALVFNAAHVFYEASQVPPVAPVVEATKVDSVSADNLKQITVKFDGQVDKVTAEEKGNYKFNREIKSISLSDDKKSVVLTLDKENFSEGNKLDNQKETKITIDGVKSSDLTRSIKQEVAFTPIDVTTPSVKEVIGLGTKAIKVVFSEPIDRASALSTSNYKIDGKSVSGFVEYAFPNTVILQVTNTTGDHKLTVSNVQDFSGLKVVPLENDFTVAVDTEAPTVVSANATDLLKVEIEFNEPLKSVSKVYNGISSKTGTVSLDKASNKVTVEFSRANALSVTENTIVIEGATDYSGNSANREVKVTPVLDTTKPEVVDVTTDVYGDNHVIKVKYSEGVFSEGTDANKTAVTPSNYTLRDKDGKVVTGKGTDGSGHPVKTITYNKDKKEATITLSGKLDKGTYSLDISGVKDNAYVPNFMLPVSKTFEIGNTATFEAVKFWIDKDGDGTKRDVYLYVTFSKPVAQDGTGDAKLISKYNVDWFGTGVYKALPTDSYVSVIAPETVKITIPYTELTFNDSAKLRLALIADTDGKFAYEGSAGYIGTINATPLNRAIDIDSATATADDKLKVKFKGVLTGVEASEFEVSVTGYTYGLKLDRHENDGKDTTAYFTLADDKKFSANPSNASATFKLKGISTSTSVTQDNFGFKVGFEPKSIGDEIKPVAEKRDDLTVLNVSRVGTTNVYRAVVNFNEDIEVVDNTSVIKLSLSPDIKVVDEVHTAEGKNLVVTFELEAGKTLDNNVVTVQLLSENANSKVVRDRAGNAAEAFTASVYID